MINKQQKIAVAKNMNKKRSQVAKTIQKNRVAAAFYSKLETGLFLIIGLASFLASMLKKMDSESNDAGAAYLMYSFSSLSIAGFIQSNNKNEKVMLATAGMFFLGLGVATDCAKPLVSTAP